MPDQRLGDRTLCVDIAREERCRGYDLAVWCLVLLNLVHESIKSHGHWPWMGIEKRLKVNGVDVLFVKSESIHIVMMDCRGHAKSHGLTCLDRAVEIRESMV